VGFALSWVAVKGKAAAGVLSDLRLLPTGARGIEGESEFVGAPAEDGWYLIVMDGAEHRLLQPDALERLSAGCDVLTCTVEEHVMFSEATGWRDGQQLWRVRHVGEDGPVGIEEDGTFPPEYPSIRDRLVKEQEAAGGSDADVDHLFDIPVVLVKSFVGYKHDERNPKFEDDAFEVLESENSKKGSWAARIFGRGSVLFLAAMLPMTACARPPATGKSAMPTADRKALLLDPSNAEWRKPAPPISHLRFETTKGVFVLELIREWGPIGADRVYNLARLGYYDDTRFHRVNRNYIVQFGLHGDPAVNAVWKDQYLKDDPPRSMNERGTFAFAMKGPTNPSTRNTQIYINLGDNSRNNGEPFTILGRVIEGMSVVDSLYSGYGENSGGGMRQGRQGPLESGGNAYMDKEFPLLDRIRRVTVSAANARR
jgi:homoserine O-acetyltransferase